MSHHPTPTQRRLAAELKKLKALALQEADPNPTWSKAELKAIDKWIGQQNEISMDRPEAIRRLVMLGLRSKKPTQGISPQKRKR